MERLQPSSVFVCSIVKAERYFGVMNSRRPLKNREKLETFLQQLGSFPFDDAAALLYGEVRAKLSQAGGPIGPYDLQIAAIALSRNLIIVTHNTEEFSRVDGVKLEDWEEG
jgi:tRNA(fMet)-specific endonuclease VapC